MVTQIEAIKRFLTACTHHDLAGLYNENMEVQVNVGQDGGSRVDREYKGKQWMEYTDGISSWKPIRIPYNANSEPSYEDRPISYSLEDHAEGIGMTGWDWKNKQSVWVGYDFDAIIGHSQKHGKRLTEEELRGISRIVESIPWVTIRKSTSGKGLHLYVFLSKPETNTHTEHSALARSILGYLSGLCNFDFNSKVDACGGILWVWHRKMKGTDGLTLIKQGTIFDKVPPDWKEHIPVIQGKQLRTKPSIILPDNNSQDDIFEEMTGQRVKVKLDEQHLRLIEWLQNNNQYVSWNAEHWLLITHTFALKQAHQTLDLKGPFDTLSPGSDLNTANAFCYPMKGGAWKVCRYTPGVAEAVTWQQDGQGWTSCYLNRIPTLPVASKLHGGMEHATGAFVFNKAPDAQKAAKELGIDFDLPPEMEVRKARMKVTPTGKLLIEIEQDQQRDNAERMKGWIADKKWWQQVFFFRDSRDDDAVIYDDIIRHLVSENEKDLGWVIKTEKNWDAEPLIHVKNLLEGHYHYGPKEVKNILGSNIIKPWIIVNKPFEPEYPGEREWNRYSAQFRFVPSTNLDDCRVPTWDAILTHLGKNLDRYVAISEWGKANAINNGADYLRCWIASLFQYPYRPLPYLFFYGEQNTGKSSFHESLALLVTRGYCRGENALQSGSGFNGELEGAIICAVEEVDMKKDKIAANRIKDWTLSPYLSIHAKHKEPYLINNTLHFIQCSNEATACPIFPGDTRVTMILVDELNTKINKEELRTRLEKEAPDFIATILNLELPPPTERLGIPVITTDDKRAAEDFTKTPLELFLSEECYNVPGETILYSELYNRFKERLEPQDTIYWTQQRMGKSMPPQYPKGRLRGSDPSWRFGNISFTPRPPNHTKSRLILIDQFLYSEDVINANRSKVTSNGDNRGS